MIDLTKSLTHMYLGEEWTLNGDTYEGLTWLSKRVKPTEQELIEVHKLVEAERIAKDKATAKTTADAIAHAKSLGFTDEMISVMYPNLGAGNV